MVIFAVFLIYFYIKQNAPSPATDLISSENEIKKFIETANFPQVQKTEVLLNIPEKNLKIFRVSYGEPQDCPSGCFFSIAEGMQYKSKIGWIKNPSWVEANDRKHILENSKYDFESSEKYLYTDEFLQTLKPISGDFYHTFLYEMVKDKDIPQEALFKITERSNPSVALYSSLLKNPAVLQDEDILTLIASRAFSTNDPTHDVYKEVREKAQSILW